MGEFKEYLGETKAVDEDAPTNSASSGAVNLEPKIKKKKKKRKLFAGHDIFEVSSDMFATIKREKVTYERMSNHFDTSEGVGADIHNFNKTNPYGGIVIQDEQTGAMVFFKRKRNKPMKDN